MSIYLLKLYSKDDEGHFQVVTLGAFTRKAKLIAAVKEHADLLGLDDCEGFRAACRDSSMSEVGEYLDNGYIREVNADTIYFDGI